MQKLPTLEFCNTETPDIDDPIDKLEEALDDPRVSQLEEVEDEPMDKPSPWTRTELVLD